MLRKIRVERQNYVFRSPVSYRQLSYVEATGLVSR